MHALARRTGTLLAALAMMIPTASSAATSLAELSWLSGCWASENGESGSGEIWSSPAGGTLLGISRTVKNGKTIEHEFMQIREIEPGRLAYIARPSGQAEGTFVLARSGPRELVFENPDHDFPQRIIYRLHSEDRLIARVEGLRNGKLRGADFPMKRARCP